MREKFTIQFINDHLDSLSFSPNTYSRTKTMAFPYKHILVIGATSGIGKAMADHFIAQDIKVTAVGRRKERLDAFVSTHGPEKASSTVFDITNLSEIPAFAEK
jgi:NADP-dependent 3-hydroxy acid dehydrogenase YdfG